MQIFNALGPIVSGLSGRVTGSFQNQTEGRPGRNGQQFSQKLRLVEATFALAHRVERDRDDDVETAVAQTGIVQRFAKPSRNGKAKVALAGILELVKEAANKSAAPIGCDSAIEMQNAMLAIRATETLGYGAGKRLGAFVAKGRDDAWGAAPTIRAQIFRALDICRADDTRCRIKKRP